MMSAPRDLTSAPWSPTSPPVEPNRSREVARFRWASELGAHGMPKPAPLERRGWVRVVEHPRFPGTWLMRIGELLGPGSEEKGGRGNKASKNLEGLQDHHERHWFRLLAEAGSAP